MGVDQTWAGRLVAPVFSVCFHLLTGLVFSSWSTIHLSQAEFHSAWTVHASEPNRSAHRRLAWVVRYVPTGTKVVPGHRGSFGADYIMTPVSGKGALRSAPYLGQALYSPCYGNSNTKAALKT